MAGDAHPGLHAKKKTLSASEQDPLERAAWRWQVTLLLRPADLVFVEESGSNKALVPRDGYAPCGQRCHGQAPRNRGRNTSILAALGPAGLVATMTVEGSTNTDVFLTYLDRVLCPALRPGQTVVLDNLFRPQKPGRAGADRSGRLPPVVFARLQSRLQPHRTRLCRTQAPAAQGQGPHPRGFGGRHRREPGDDHPSSRARLVQTLRLPTGCSIILKSAVVNTMAWRGSCKPGTVATTLRVAVSMTERLLSALLPEYTNLPSGVSAAP